VHSLKIRKREEPRDRQRKGFTNGWFNETEFPRVKERRV
tara:strand:+ start:447 stop:563 length:117 start_codon:yes stop_codon:yes gene_type:complete